MTERGFQINTYNDLPGLAWFYLSGPMVGDAYLLNYAIEAEVARGTTCFVFNLARLEVLHSDGAARLLALGGQMESRGGVVILEGVSGDSLRMLLQVIPELTTVLRCIKITGDQTGSLAVLGKNAAVSSSQG